MFFPLTPNPFNSLHDFQCNNRSVLILGLVPWDDPTVGIPTKSLKSYVSERTLGTFLRLKLSPPDLPRTLRRTVGLRSTTTIIVTKNLVLNSSFLRLFIMFKRTKMKIGEC